MSWPELVGHEAVWARLTRLLADERLPHALLFTGPPGIGKALLADLARQCVQKGWSRLQWSVLDWNTPSIEFYKSLGADLMDEWTVCRVGGPALTALAQGAR